MIMISHVEDEDESDNIFGLVAPECHPTFIGVAPSGFLVASISMPYRDGLDQVEPVVSAFSNSKHPRTMNPSTLMSALVHFTFTFPFPIPIPTVKHNA